jgi:hypothetical protein
MNVNRIRGEASMSERMVAQVRDFSKSTGYAKFLLVTIASHLHYKAEYAYPSLDTLARETTLSKPTVLKLITGLVALGELEVLRGQGRGHPNRYRITIAHEAHDERPDEDDPDQAKGKARPDQHPPARSDEDNDDRVKGKPYLYLLPTPTDMEKVNDDAEKVNTDPGKGKASVNPKEVLRTSKDNTERVAFEMEKVKDPDPGEWIMQNRVYGQHHVCGALHQPGTPCPGPGVPAERSP